jgi:hypothetical protein
LATVQENAVEPKAKDGDKSKKQPIHKVRLRGKDLRIKVKSSP